MSNNIRSYNAAALIKQISKNPNITNYFIPGVQSVGVNNNIDSVSITQTGKIQSFDDINLPSSIDITMEKFLSNKDRFFLELCSEFLFEKTTPLTYSNSFILNKNILGNVVSSWNAGTKADVRRYNIPEIDIELIIKENEEVVSTVGVDADQILSFNNLLISSLEYDLDVGGNISESVSFTGTQCVTKTALSYSFDTITGLENPVTSARLLRRKDVVNDLSIYPALIDEYCNQNLFFNSQEVYGIQNIKISANLNYNTFIDTGILRQDDSLNWFKTLDRIDVSCEFTLILQKEQVEDFINKISNRGKERICIIAKTQTDTGYRFFIWNLGNGNIVSSISTSGGSTSGDLRILTVSYLNNKSDFVTYTQDQISDSVLNPSLFNQTTESF